LLLCVVHNPDIGDHLGIVGDYGAESADRPGSYWNSEQPIGKERGKTSTDSHHALLLADLDIQGAQLGTVSYVCYSK
jgi:hypothetical protein